MHQIKDIFSLYTIKILFRIKILLKSDFGVLKVSSPLHLDNQANLLQLEHTVAIRKPLSTLSREDKAGPEELYKATEPSEPRLVLSVSSWITGKALMLWDLMFNSRYSLQGSSAILCGHKCQRRARANSLKRQRLCFGPRVVVYASWP